LESKNSIFSKQNIKMAYNQQNQGYPQGYGQSPQQQQFSPPQQRPQRPSIQQQHPRQTSYDTVTISPGSSASQIPPYGQNYPQNYPPIPSQYQPPPSHQQQVLVQQKSPPSVTSSGFVRKRTVRQIPLTPQGNLVIDVPVADRVIKMGKYSDGDEFTHMRYTAVTCPPDEFSKRGYILRQQELGRHTEIFIVVTMYNEDDFLFCKSMQALMKNIAYLTTRTRSKVWGDEGWKKAIICIVSDGRSKVNPRVLDVLGIMGIYQNG
jgi:chitin synthase